LAASSIISVTPKPGAIPVPGILNEGMNLNQTSFALQSTENSSSTAPSELNDVEQHNNNNNDSNNNMNCTVEINDAIVVQNIAMSKPVIFLSKPNGKKSDPKNDLESIGHRYRKSITLMISMFIILFLCIAVIIRVCWTGHCCRTIHQKDEDQNTAVISTRTFRTLDELMIDGVLLSTSNITRYGTVEDWDVSYIGNFSSLFSSSCNMNTVSFNADIVVGI
jgi:hypothetical protein